MSAQHTPSPHLPELLEALRELVCSAPDGLECKDLHHSARERHEYGDECPPAARYLRALAKARAAIAKATGA